MEAELNNTMDQTSQDVAKRPPRSHHSSNSDSGPLPTDSMVTVPLSEAADDNDATEEEDHVPSRGQKPQITLDERRLSSRPTSAELLQAIRERRESDASIETPVLNSPTISLPEDESPRGRDSFARSRSSSSGSDRSVPVDWAELEKKEEQEPQEDGQDKAMALLLARLEQENNALKANPKAGLRTTRIRSQSRPPSISQLKRLVKEQESQQVRYSQLPSPPPMTELEFWAALVRDYTQTVQRLPTLTLNKIRGGIPAPLRGVVWQSASGARDKLIEDQYDSLCGEPSPYENIINKDLGRSFPGVEMFKDPEGEGQKMLGRVLKCFSLYDTKIGYCQGLGFLVGPLLMQMGDKEAFCVLVRLMEDYDLRSCFLPDLSGLHLRIFQFQRLLQHHMPQLAAHLDSLGIGSAYLSQWFLSFFAVTCPLPMLFRIYDVLFAEGASETIMRVALALMKRNEQKIIAMCEMEDAMQLLLGRSLWDPYGRNTKSADQLVNDFVSFTNDVTRERLQGLESDFKDSQKDGSSGEVLKSATSFLGRLHSSIKSVSLSPGLVAPSRPSSFLRRTPSKQSLASTMLSEPGSEGSTGTQSTALTDFSRGSSGDALSLKSGHGSVAFSIRTGASTKDRDMHYQIEQLLMSVSQLQRQNTELEAALQQQREDRKEDHRLVRSVIHQIRDNKGSQSSLAAPSSRESRRRTTITAASTPITSTPSVTIDFTNPEAPSSPSIPPEIAEIISTLDSRFPSTQTHHRASSMFETKEVLKDSLSRTKERLASEVIRTSSLQRDLYDSKAELQSARDELKDTRQRLQEIYHQNQKCEKTIQELRSGARKGSLPWLSSSGGDQNSDTNSLSSLSRTNTADSSMSMTTSPISTTGTNGLRELRLGRANSNSATQNKKPSNQHFSTYSSRQSQVFNKRTSSLAAQSLLTTETPVDSEALLLELVNAKTAEAVARQELEEFRSKFEGMKRAMGVVSLPSGNVGSRSPGTTPVTTPATTPDVQGSGVGAGAGAGGFWSGWKRSVSSSNVHLG